MVADLGCMLLNNMSKSVSVCRLLLQDTSKTSGSLVVPLIEVFGMGKAHNQHATFDFLAPVFANLTLVRVGRDVFLGEHFGYPLHKLICFTEHPNLIRRGGVISTIKNCCLSVEHLERIYHEDYANALPYLLLPLAGPEEIDVDDMDGMPSELQFLEETKKRERDPYLRSQLLEALILIGSTRHGRDYMRSKKVYPIIREMHLAEADEQVAVTADTLVQLLMRDEEQVLDADGNPISDPVEAELVAAAREKVAEIEGEEEDIIGALV